MRRQQRTDARGEVLKAALISSALGLVCTAAGAQTCESIRAQIDQKIRATGTADFTLTTVPAEASTAGKLVGTCDLGTKKILYTRAAVAGNASAVTAASAVKPNRAKPAANPPMLTECKDGSMSVGGDCKK
jgi:Protein of unknown function (DUF1161)